MAEATDMMWKSLGQVVSGVECFYQLDSFRGDLPSHEETQLRGAAFCLLDHIRETGKMFSMDSVFEIASPAGARLEIIFQPYPQAIWAGAVMLPVTQIHLAPHAVN